MQKNNVEYSLYLVTDRVLAGRKSLIDIIKQAIKGGVTIVQYRDKNESTGNMIKTSLDLQILTKLKNIPLIINDRLDVMLAINADGLHVGQDDMPAAIARQLIGKNKILGVSVKTVEQSIKAEKDGADYLGVGDIFGTMTKPDAGQPIGLDILQQIRQAVSIPIVGIGGINLTNANDVIISGADGIAVISAIIGQDDPYASAKKLSSIIKSSRKKV